MKSSGIIIILVLTNLFLASLTAWQSSNKETVFVLTPMIDVWPDSVPLHTDERKKLEQQFSFQPEARGLKQVYSHMGATLSFHDLLRGIHFLETSTVPLSEAQKTDVLNKLRVMQKDHQRLQKIQKDLVIKEGKLMGILDQLEEK